MEIAVAVIARPRSPTLDACMGALRDADAAAASSIGLSRPKAASTLGASSSTHGSPHASISWGTSE